MKRSRFSFERLEIRSLLSAAGMLDSVSFTAIQSTPEAAEVEIIAPEQTTTTIQLIGGQTIVLDVEPQVAVGDLAGIAFFLSQGQGPPTPEVAGVIASGELTADGLLSIEGVGDLQAPFEVAGAATKTHLMSGSLGVKVEQSEFKFASLDNVDVEVEQTTAAGPLKLKGTLNDGTYKPGEGITFNAKLEITDDFVYEKSPIKATLKSGGFVQVHIEQSDLKEATFSGNELLVEIDVGDNPLMLAGTLEKGKYENGLIDFNARLTLSEEWEYTQPTFTARLSQGTVSVQVEANALKEAEFNVMGEADVTIPNSNGLKFGGTVKGKYENGKIDLEGSISLLSPVELQQGGVRVVIPAGENVGVRIRGENILVRMRDVSFESSTSLGPYTLEFAGKIKTATVRNGYLQLVGNAELTEPVVIRSRGDWELKLVSAKLNLIILGERITLPLIYDLQFALCRIQPDPDPEIIGLRPANRFAESG